jgi:hypothetical protein
LTVSAETRSAIEGQPEGDAWWMKNSQNDGNLTLDPAVGSYRSRLTMRADWFERAFSRRLSTA